MELNKRLQPIGSIPDDKGTINTGVSFGMQNKRNAVTGTRIRNFNFSQGFGGTLTLGGTANGNGQFVLENASGGTIVTGDQNGITVTNGSITIKNSSSQNAIDSMGVVSNSNNFINTQSTSLSANQSFTGTTPTNVTGGSLSFVTTRTATIMITQTTYSYLVEPGSTNFADSEVYLNIDGVSGYAPIYMNAGNDHMITQSSNLIFPISAGTHTVKMQGFLNNIYMGTPSFTLAAFVLNYIFYGT